MCGMQLKWYLEIYSINIILEKKKSMTYVEVMSFSYLNV